MKTKLSSVVALHRTLGAAKMDGLQSKDRCTLVKILQATRPFAENFDKFSADMFKAQAPSNLEELQEKVRSNAPDAEDARKAIRAYNSTTSKYLTEELETEVEIEYLKLSEELFNKLLESNSNWSVAEALLAWECIVDKK